MKSCEGVIVSKVLPHGFAENAGLHQRDVILSVNGHKLDRHGIVIEKNHDVRKQNLFDILQMNPPLEPAHLTLWRKGKTIKKSALVKVSPTLTFPSQPLWSRMNFMCLEGIIIQEVSLELIEALHQTYGIDPCFLMREYLESKSKLLITHVCPETAAEDLFIEVGDFVDRLNGAKVQSLRQLEKALDGNIKTKGSKSILVETSSGLMANLILKWDRKEPKPWAIRKPQEPSNK
jgi:S1-C subfamily serine protease